MTAVRVLPSSNAKTRHKRLSLTPRQSSTQFNGACYANGYLAQCVAKAFHVFRVISHRLAALDVHELFQRLQGQSREHVIQMKERLLKQLTSGYKTPTQARLFVAMLLDEYATLCDASGTCANHMSHELVSLRDTMLLLFFRA